MIRITTILCYAALTWGAAITLGGCKAQTPTEKRPNILFVLADDQSFPYASAYGTSGISTPAFDEVARQGILFYDAFAAAPQCSPSRAAILTGKEIWQLAEAGTHGSSFPRKFEVFTDLLESAGYQIGYTGKPWAPGDWKTMGWKRNPVGPEYDHEKLSPPTSGISKVDYYGNFVDFFHETKRDKPFFFWFGSHEPHRGYTPGSGILAGLDPMKAFVPDFLPDDSVVRSDILDYTLEIQWYDQQLGKILRFLKEQGALENTLVVVTSDNGMPFPSAKANLMDYGSHVPLAICWPGHIKPGGVSHDLVSLTDLAPTFLAVADVKQVSAMTGKSLVPLWQRDDSARRQTHRRFVLTGRERHSDSRPDDLGYPSRAIRTPNFLLILNLKPDRWPAGNPAPAVRPPLAPPGADPKDFKPIGLGYEDIDEPSPTKTLMAKNPGRWPRMFAEGFEKRPGVELYDVQRDPGCTVNLASDPAFGAVRDSLERILKEQLTAEGDPRMLGYGDIFESYPRFGLMRNWGGFQKRGAYNPAFEVKNNPEKK
jgi:uncharacterized sulfatase